LDINFIYFKIGTHLASKWIKYWFRQFLPLL
jgi:hypothetical protein